MSGSSASAAARSAAGSAARTSVAIDAAQIWWSRGLRTGLLVTVLLLAANRLDLAASNVIAVSLGAAFTGFADTTAPHRNRFVGLSITLLAYVLAVLWGGLIADDWVLRIAGSAVAAAVCGFVGVLGPRCALGGTITLVVVTIYAGTPIGLAGDLGDAGWLAIGGCAYLAVAMASRPRQRLVGVRTELAVAFCAVGNAAAAADASLSATGIATMTTNAARRAAAADLGAMSASWSVGLAEDAEHLRRSLIALRTEPSDAAARLTRAAAETAQAIGWALRVAPLRRRVPAKLQRTVDLATAARRAGVPAPLIDEVVAPLQHAVAALAPPWPVGRRAVFGAPPALAEAPWHRLRAGLRRDDPFARHAIRLALAIAVGTAIAAMWLPLHGYWVPLTVAWIAKPDLAGTVARVAMRLGGTIVGLAAAALAAVLITGPTGYSVTVGGGAFLVGAFLVANYTVAVTGITVFVIVLMGLVGDPVDTTLLPRLIDTVVAGGLVVAASLVLPRLLGADMPRDVAQLARCGAAYCRSVFADEPDAMTTYRRAVLDARTQAENAAIAAAGEPVHHDLDPAVALAILADLRGVSAHLLRRHELAEAGMADADPELCDTAVDALLQLADRLESLDRPTEPWRLPPACHGDALGLLTPLAEAHARLPAAT